MNSLPYSFSEQGSWNSSLVEIARLQPLFSATPKDAAHEPRPRPVRARSCADLDSPANRRWRPKLAEMALHPLQLAQRKLHLPAALQGTDHPLQYYVHDQHRLAARQAPSLQLPQLDELGLDSSACSPSRATSSRYSTIFASPDPIDANYHTADEAEVRAMLGNAV